MDKSNTAIRDFRAQVREWLYAHVPREPRPVDGPESLAFDKGWQKMQYQGGWAGIDWPREHGGRGLTLAEQMIWHEEYARADAPTVGNLYVGLNHAGPTLIMEGSAAQKAHHLQRILSGESVWCQGFSEPGAGSDLAGLKTRADIDGDELVVTGSKIWTSFGHVADYQELLLRTGPPGQRHRGLTWVICDMRAPGITVRPIINMTGAHELNQVFYDGVRLPLANVVGEVGEGWRVAMTTLGFERGTGMICMQVELARKVERLIDYAARTVDARGRPLIRDESVAALLSTLRAEVAALRAMAHANVERNVRSGKPGAEGTLVALYYGLLERRVSRAGFDIAGSGALELRRDVRDKTWQYLVNFPRTISGGSAQIRRNIIGERVLGLPKG